MKKLVLVVSCIAALLMFFPSQLPAPGLPTFEVLKTCVMEGDQWYYKIVVTNTNTYSQPILVTGYDGGSLLFTNQEVLPGQPYVFPYGYSDTCPASSNTVQVTSAFTNPAYPPAQGYVYNASSTATCRCIGDGCTLTQGYWKTHNDYGPAPSDDTWEQLPDGEETDFFSSGLDYYVVMWTDPGESNPYFSLAHQYIAAVLNQYKGAEAPPEVVNAIAAATTLFETYSPGQVGGKGNGTVKAMFKALIPTLDNYNMGITGPGHCDSILR